MAVFDLNQPASSLSEEDGCLDLSNYFEKLPKDVIHHKFIDTPGESVYWFPRVSASVVTVLGNLLLVLMNALREAVVCSSSLVHGTQTEFKNFTRGVNCFIGDSDAQMLITRMEQRYKMVFVPFTAIDNHRRSVTVGSGLLKKETAEAYGWLLRAFKKAFVRPPNIVVTDQDGAMRLAVAAEFPESKHRLCTLWLFRRDPQPSLFLEAEVSNCSITRTVLIFVQKFMGVKKPDKVKVKNPTGVRPKGREKQKRIKSGREISMKKSIKKRNWLSVCVGIYCHIGVSGHDRMLSHVGVRKVLLVVHSAEGFLL
ncbi:DNA-directed DNA polymerase [Tanacetum coccineum]|uniref:DNA-directed DNA polymerase n=1 Tax=Tanacetum coccineum TaxID=301880 RepID=A0ABQ5EU70_9ASTR